MKKIMKMLLVPFLCLLVLPTGIASADTGNQEVINELLGVPIVVYGETLSNDQKEEVKTAFGVKDASQVEEYTVTAKDLARYIGGNPNSRMFSSAKITLTEEGTGIVIKRVTPGNITQVTDDMYINAMITAGVENAEVEVASPVAVTGHSALAGIYKAYEASGVELDAERMDVASDELNLMTDLVSEQGIEEQKVTELLTQIKQQIAEQNPVTREEVEQIVQEQLSALGIQLTEEEQQRLIDLFDRIRGLNINFENVRTQLEDLSTALQDTLQNVVENEGFWNSVKEFFTNLMNAISSIFGGGTENESTN